ncbi:MAG: V-type ATP synthase subunit B [Myxococcota bacterium]
MVGLRRYRRLAAIVGDVVWVHARGVAVGDVAQIDHPDGRPSLARVIEIHEDQVACQVFAGAKGLSTSSRVRFLGEPLRVTYSNHILGRVFRGNGLPTDGGPTLETEPRIDIGGPIVNPVRRALPAKMIRTDVPMIDVFNALVESQKIPIFSVPGEPYNQLLARIGFQADADIVVFGGLGLIFDDYHFFRQAFIDHGVFHRTVMFVNLASDPIVERVLVPDLALAVAERFAVEQDQRVLVLLTDMTAFADALKEIGISMEHIPSNRGYMGDLYTQLARRYEKACDFKGAGSVTILAVTTMPGDDVTHPVPDNTGYITEGQFYLHDGVLDPFGSLSRLKQRVMGKVTRKDHSQVMNTMIRLYSGAREARQKKSMAFELSALDHKLLRFGDIFRREFMDVNASMSLEAALDRSWQIMANCFDRSELLIRKSLLDEFLPEARSESEST